MSRGRLLMALVWATAIGTIVALVRGDERVLSIEIWLAGFSVWLAGIVFVRLVEALPFAPSQLLPMITRPDWRKRPAPDMRPRQLRSLESLVLRARDNERAHAQQLRPRLAALAEHRLPIQHGIDPHRQPERVAALLGDTAWLLNPAATTRRPTIAELQAFLDTIGSDTR